MEIRRLRPEEWAHYKTLRLKALADAPYAFSSSAAEEARLPDEQWQEWARSTIFVSSHEGQWVGMVGAHQGSGPRIVVVWGMWVDPGMRRTGIGHRLLEAVADWARTEGAQRLRLGVTDSNKTAVNFYESHGFVPTGRQEQLRSDPSLTEIEMERNLNA